MTHFRIHRVRLFAVPIIAAAACAGLLHAQEALTFYFIDVEGGQATLIVTPSHQSLLVDAGYGGFDDRDPNRIVAAARDARIDHIDYFFLTHFHGDHDGGVPALVRQLPIRTFIDYGAPTETDKNVLAQYEAYKAVRDRGHHVLASPGDRLPLPGLEVDVISAGGKTLDKPLAGAGQPNPACAGFEPRSEDWSENIRSSGLRLRYGSFRFLNPGDFSWNGIVNLVCPNNLVGEIDLYLVAHHGNADTNLPALLAALKPRVAIVNNGQMKGGAPAALATLLRLEGLADLWQLHRSERQGAENAPEQFIANLDDGATGHWIKATATKDGRFTVVNGRNGLTRSY